MRSFEIMTIMMTIASQKAKISGNPVMAIPPCGGKAMYAFPSKRKISPPLILIPFKNFGKCEERKSGRKFLRPLVVYYLFAVIPRILSSFSRS